MHSSRTKGFTLVELMVVVALIAILTAIAIPAYNAFLSESELATARTNADTLRIYLEDWRLDNGTYAIGGNADYDPEDPAIEAALTWTPDGDQDLFDYEVVGATTNDYTVEVVFGPSGRWIRCEDRMNNCCDGTGAVTACP